MQAPLTPHETRRYSRQLLLPGVGVAGQQRLKAARVLCIGAGGLGSPAALYLGAAGVGTIGIVDFDTVDISNLQRQIIHGTSNVGRSKLASARARLTAINPHVAIEEHDTRFTADNAIDLVSAYDVILDGTDNFPTRYLVNDACVWHDGRTSTAASFASKGRPRCSRRPADRATAVCIPSHRLRA